MRVGQYLGRRDRAKAGTKEQKDDSALLTEDFNQGPFQMISERTVLSTLHRKGYRRQMAVLTPILSAVNKSKRL